MEGHSGTRASQWLILGALGLAIVVMRAHTYDEPFERDLNIYAVIGHELLEGRALYADLYDQKPPAVYLTYAAAELFVGNGPAQKYVLGVGAALATLLGVFFYVVRATGDRSAGLWAALFWTLVCSDMMLQANQPNTEVFINALAVWAVGLWLTTHGPALDVRRALGVGALFAAASLFKHVVVVPAALLAVAHVARPPAGRSRRTALLEVGSAAAVGLALWSASFAWFAWAGSFDDYYATVVSYSIEYSAQRRGLLGNLVYSLRPDIALPDDLRFALVLAVPAALGAIVGLWRGRARRPWVLWLAWAVGTGLAIALPGRFAPHYYQLWLPVVAVGGGLALAELGSAPRRWQRARPVLGTLAGLLLALHTLPPFVLLSPDEWSVMKYGEGFVVTRDLGRQLDDLLRDDETFFEWGAEPGLYAVSGRRPIAGVLNARFTLDYGGVLQQRLTQRTLADLTRAPPDLIVLEEGTLLATPREHPVFAWIDANYTTFQRVDRFRLAARRGSDLARRQGIP